MCFGLLDPDSGSVHQQAKKAKENLDFHYFLLLYGFLSVKTDVNVRSKSDKQENLRKKN
jgi:hypothetical protein